MTVRLDVSKALIVVWCDCCAWFAVPVFDRRDGHTVACEHERREHPDVYQARDAAKSWRTANLIPEPDDL